MTLARTQHLESVLYGAVILKLHYAREGANKPSYPIYWVVVTELR